MGLCPPSLCCVLVAWDAPLTWQAASEVQMMSACLPCCYSWHRAPEPVPRALRGAWALALPACSSPACGSARLLQPKAWCWFQLCGFLLGLAWSHGAGWSCVFDLPSMEPAAPAGAAGWRRRYPGPIQSLGWAGTGMGCVRQQKGKHGRAALAKCSLCVFPCPDYVRELQQR